VDFLPNEDLISTEDPAYVKQNIGTCRHAKIRCRSLCRFGGGSPHTLKDWAIL